MEGTADGLKSKIKPAWKGQRLIKSTSNNNYGCSHGYQLHNNHTSAMCRSKKDGHNYTATKENQMGGFKWGT
jgi:hypothetical protein